MKGSTLTAVLRASRSQRGTRLVLVALTTAANDDGTETYQSVESLMALSGLSERRVQQGLRALEAAGEIRADGRGPRGTTKYRIVVGLAPGVQPTAPLGVSEGCSPLHRGVQFSTEGGALSDTGGCKNEHFAVQPTAPDPPVDPPIDPPTDPVSATRARGRVRKLLTGIGWQQPEPTVSALAERLDRAVAAGQTSAFALVVREWAARGYKPASLLDKLDAALSGRETWAVNGYRNGASLHPPASPAETGAAADAHNARALAKLARLEAAGT